MGLFGEDGFFGKQARIDRKAKRRDDAAPGSAEYNRMQNQINRISGEGGGLFDDNYLNPFGTQSSFQSSKFKTNDEKVGEYGDFDFSKFDVSNPADVSAIQKEMIKQNFLPETYVNRQGETVSSADGVFGSMTDEAYKKFVNAQRANQGLDGYTYGDNQNSTGTYGQDTGSKTTSNMYTPGGWGVHNMSGSGTGNQVPSSNQDLLMQNILQNNQPNAMGPQNNPNPGYGEQIMNFFSKINPFD
jgi:hypothetical protein